MFRRLTAVNGGIWWDGQTRRIAVLSYCLGLSGDDDGSLVLSGDGAGGYGCYQGPRRIK